MLVIRSNVSKRIGHNTYRLQNCGCYKKVKLKDRVMKINHQQVKLSTSTIIQHKLTQNLLKDDQYEELETAKI